MKKNLYKYLAGNEYPGRGIVLGQSPDGSKVFVAYWIMGRSANSRNRVFEPIEGGIRTVAADPAKLEDPHLIIYNAVLTLRGDHRCDQRRPDRHDCPVHERQPLPWVQLRGRPLPPAPTKTMRRTSPRASPVS